MARHGNRKWTAQRLIYSGILMAWGEQRQLTERFRAVRAFLKQTRKHWMMGSSYEGWLVAQQREVHRLMPLIVQRLRKLMRALPSNEQDRRWEALAVDGSQITCPRTIANQQAMGDVGKPDGVPQLSLTTIVHLGTGLLWDFRVGPGIASERAHLRDMLADLPKRSLAVTDAGFIGYSFCYDLFKQQQHFLLRVGGNIHLLKSLGYDVNIEGQTVYLWPNEQQYKNQPPLRLRLIVRQEGQQSIYLVTSVLDEKQLSDQEAGEIYRRRWGIEVQFRTMKQTMQHHLVRSRTPENCYLEMIWAVLGVWLLQLMTARHIAAAGGDPHLASPAQARNCVRRVLRNQSPSSCRHQGFRRALAQCLIDQYERKRPKSSRDYPRKKPHKPPGKPIIKSPNPTQLRKAERLTPISMIT